MDIKKTKVYISTTSWNFYFVRPCEDLEISLVPSTEIEEDLLERYKKLEIEFDALQVRLSQAYAQALKERGE